MIFVVQPHFKTCSKNIKHHFVDLFFRSFSLFDSFQQVLVSWHFEIQTGIKNSFAVKNGSPVRHYQSFKSEFAPKKVGNNIFALTSPFAVNKVITCHNSGSPGINSCFKSRHINFVQFSFFDNRIATSSVKIGVVADEMFESSHNSAALNTIDILFNHSGSKPWIFAHIFKISSALRNSVNVHSGSKQNCDIACAAFFAKRFSVFIRKFGIPGSSERKSTRKSGSFFQTGGSVLLKSDSLAGISHIKWSHSKSLDIRDIKIPKTINHFAFFIEGHFF